MKPTLAIDFDGTIATYEEDKFSEATTGKPIEGAIEFIRALATKYEIVIFSARARTDRGKNAILEWARENNIRNLIKDVTHEKRYSFLAFVDDRAIPFRNSSDYVDIARGLGVEI